jgi:sulfur transfer complex TusBCD TusB component (DsrH family)
MSVYASAQDLRARGIAETQVEKGIVITEDIEGRFLKDAMERASRVISW